MPLRTTKCGDGVDPYVSDLSNRTLRVVTIAADGFVLISDVDKDGNNVTGNDRFQGFCMDLFSWISTELGFKYEYYEVEDGQFGIYDSKTGKWNGMIGDVLYGKADIVMAPLFITSERQKVGDFTLPYYDNGMVFAIKKTASRGNEGDVPDHDVRDEDKETGFWEAVWQSFVALVQLGPEFLPASLSGRISAFFWGIGILVAISTYTANLAAFLTVKNMDNSINSAEDLLGQDMLGVFVLVYGGMALALIVLIGEFIYTCAQDAKKPDTDVRG
ncbi:glutamate receptor 1-like [Branchiostoma floridae]|uniref:Glutamate receptor 1-like n=1 Tax=Branchiostoma floridae TaxID=7739 RepID=A0A9J7LQT7_BRAFL|nr:glutamate receptor 1-like [Branchiostoma floridae]